MKKYNGHVAPVHIFFSGSGDTGKSHSVKKNVYSNIKNIALSLQRPSKTIRFGLGIKPGRTLHGLNNKSKNALRNKLSEIKFLVIDEVSIVSNDL